MAGLDALLQRIARSLEEAGAQQPGDDLRARLGYGTEDEDDDEPASEPVWEPETGREPETARAAASWKPKTVWSPETSGRPPRAGATQRAAETRGAPTADHSLGGAPASRATLPHAHASAVSVYSERIRARLRTPDALREAFVIKEILDRPLSGRRGR